MSIESDFEEILAYAHFWNWAPDWNVVREIYEKVPSSYSVLKPFAYSYLEELIRTMTSEYGIELKDDEGNPKWRKVGMRLICLAIDENEDNKECVLLLNEMKKYFSPMNPYEKGANRNNVLHGVMHPRFWDKESFEMLIHDIARISKYSKF